MNCLSLIKNTTKRILASGMAAIQGLHLTTYNEWHPQLDEALHSLPEADLCPHELFRALVRNPGPVPKRAVLVTEKKEPVAVVGLRQKRDSHRGDYWEPITQWIVPGMLFPVKKGYLNKALSALGLDVEVGWWRWEAPPPQISGLRGLRSTPTHGVHLVKDDFEQYWRSKGHYKRLANIRNRCRNFDFKVNAPGMVEWTVRNWGAKWGPSDGSEMPDLADRLLVAQYLAKRGLCHALSLHDQDTPVAAATLLSHRTTAVAYVNYRNPQYDWHQAMTRLIDLSFTWARDAGFETLDIGGGHDYKDHWAPPNAEKWEFRVCPVYILLARRCSDMLR
jgi:hypothetical protein